MYHTEVSTNAAPHPPFSLLGECFSEANLDQAESKLASPLKSLVANKQMDISVKIEIMNTYFFLSVSHPWHQVKERT